MFKNVLFLLFIYGIKNGSSRSSPQEQTLESKAVSANGIKKNEVGANGAEANWEKVARNFRNPVLEYLLGANSERTRGPPQKGVVREIQHSQTLLLPNFLGSSFPGVFMNQLPLMEPQGKPSPEGSKNQENSASDNFWNLMKNKTRPEGTEKLQESVVSSPVLQLNKNSEGGKESTSVQTYPAVAVVINTFDKDGSLKSSLTHFQPDFNSLGAKQNIKGVTNVLGGKNGDKNDGRKPGGGVRQGISWPFAGYFPIVINDPFLSVYNAFATSMYNAVSSMVEYGPEADICLKEKGGIRQEEKMPSVLRHRSELTETDSNIFDEIRMESGNFDGRNRRQSRSGRGRREATSIIVKSREGDKVEVSLEEPNGPIMDGTRGSDLILRKGGIAIAGPGGAATAYTGGTAIVGPYGTVYKSPEGTAILGPFSRVVDITDDTSFEEILKMHKEMQNQEPAVVPGPENGVGFTNFRNVFSYKTRLPVTFEAKPQARSFARTRPNILRLKEESIVKAIEEMKESEFRKIVQDVPFEQRGASGNETTLVFRPKSKAEAGRNGVALSAPTSHAVLYPGQKARIYFEPESVASAGPSGFAHAHSDLFVTYVTGNATGAAQERRRRSLKSIFLKKID